MVRHSGFTELHRHLDVSIRPSTLLGLAQERGLESASTSLERFQEKLFLRKPLQSLNDVLAQFTLFQKVLDSPEVLERVAFECAEDCYREGTRQVEFRFSPSFITEHNKMSWDYLIEGVARGVRRAQEKYSELHVGLICIVSRDYGLDEAAKVVEFYSKNAKKFVAIDLAGNEADYPNHTFAEVFRGLPPGTPRTIHAGEAAGPDSVWSAIEDLGATRIGHGIRSIEDPELIAYLRNHSICLEVCPTSNWLTRCVPSLEEHPLPRLIRSGVRACINTDDPGFFAVTLPHEIRVAREKLGLSEDEIQDCLRTAEDFLF